MSVTPIITRQRADARLAGATPARKLARFTECRETWRAHLDTATTRPPVTRSVLPKPCAAKGKGLGRLRHVLSKKGGDLPHPTATPAFAPLKNDND